jgi:polysaccharide export outer membrane protein
MLPRLRVASFLSICGLSLAFVAGCQPGADLPPAPPYEASVYRLGVGDHVRIIVYNDDKLTNTFRVSDGGTLALPLLGSEKALGLTTDELAHQISSELQERQLLNNASVSVEVTDYRPISVLGEVAHPGEFPYQPGMTMLTAVAVAGGFTYRAVEGYAFVVRHDQSKLVEGTLTPHDFVAPGDVIKIYERTF